MRSVIGVFLLSMATGSTAQVPSGQVARSSAGQVGQRRMSVDAEPLARLNTRIANRVQSRIRNRIDRVYDPQANATSPFEVAGEQVRASGRATRR